MVSSRRALLALVASAAVISACRKGQTSTSPEAAVAVAPDFAASDAEGQPRTLAALTERGPAVLVFYRGHW